MEENNNVSGDSVPMKKIGVCLTCHKHGRVFDVGCSCPSFTYLNSDETVVFVTLHAAHYFCSVQCLVNWGH
jgi:nitrate reductase cytochrome c-type subunit